MPAVECANHVGVLAKCDPHQRHQPVVALAVALGLRQHNHISAVALPAEEL